MQSYSILVCERYWDGYPHSEVIKGQVIPFSHEAMCGNI